MIVWIHVGKREKKRYGDDRKTENSDLPTRLDHGVRLSYTGRVQKPWLLQRHSGKYTPGSG